MRLQEITKGGVSEISKSSSLRAGFFDQSQIAITLMRIPTLDIGVAVMISTPKKNVAKRTG